MYINSEYQMYVLTWCIPPANKFNAEYITAVSLAARPARKIHSQMGSSRINKTIRIDKGLKSYYHGPDN